MIIGPEKRMKDRKDDLYETHPQAVHALLKHEKLNPVIWEPCAGRGAISSILMENGHIVISQDLSKHDNAVVAIETGIDFLMEWKLPYRADVKEIKQIVTNPPYKLANDFIRKGISLECDCVMLMPITYLGGDGRSDIIDNHLNHVWVGKERLPTMHRDAFEGNKINSSMIIFAWFYFNWIPHHPDTGFVVRRISWR